MSVKNALLSQCLQHHISAGQLAFIIWIIGAELPFGNAVIFDKLFTFGRKSKNNWVEDYFGTESVLDSDGHLHKSVGQRGTGDIKEIQLSMTIYSLFRHGKENTNTSSTFFQVEEIGVCMSHKENGTRVHIGQ